MFLNSWLSDNESQNIAHSRRLIFVDNYIIRLEVNDSESCNWIDFIDMLLDLV